MGAGTTPGASRGARVTRTDCDVAVIGAGISGLAAALALETEGFRVTVLEAGDRTGGRIRSMQQLGDNAEAGATFIGAGYRRFMALAERFDIPLIDVTPILEFFREQELVLAGEIVRQSEWPDHAANPFPDDDRELMPWNYHRVLTMRDNPLADPADWLDPRHAALDVSMREWMHSLGLGDEVVRLGYGINTTFGRDADDVSALLMLFRGAFSKAQRRLAPGDSLGFTVERGVQRVPDAIAAALADGVEFGAEVMAIEDTGDTVRVGLADGRRVIAKRVVCSLPFGVLRGIALGPPLAGAQAEAVRELPHQAITQVYLRPKRAFWESDGYAPSLFTDTLAGMVTAVRRGSAPGEVRHFSCWVVGPNAERLEGASEAEAGAAVIAAIEAVRPAAVGQLELIGLTAWGSDPRAAGAWAYFRPGQIRRFAAEMASPHGRIHFCGEHLAATCRGLEGALESAERVALEVMAAEA
jgi:monoamine oxidase